MDNNQGLWDLKAINSQGLWELKAITLLSLNASLHAKSLITTESELHAVYRVNKIPNKL